MRAGLHRGLRRVGLDLVRYDAERFPELRRLQLLRDRRADLVLDVGANDGTFVGGLRAGGYRGRIVSFEPQSAAFSKLLAATAGDPDWDCRRVALGATEGEVELHLAGNSSSSSLLDMTTQHVTSAPESRYIGSESVRVVRLDAIRDEHVRPTDRVYLKVDVQGSELAVLEGAEVTLRQAVVVDAELSLVPLYDGAPTFDVVIEHLSERGFGLLALEPVFADPATGRLLQVDGLFGRDSG
jgi:FkbM family methyltransferase